MLFESIVAVFLMCLVAKYLAVIKKEGRRFRAGRARYCRGDLVRTCT